VGGAAAELLVSSLTIAVADEMLPTLTDSAGFSGLLSLLLLKQKQKQKKTKWMMPIVFLVSESNCTVTLRRNHLQMECLTPPPKKKN
jgi:ribosomal protein L32